ncbi:MAG: ABC transporter ATP-binding protein [Pseudomonadota bacterium]|nr:ABC transporter ATP-binding protein [Pseudomonadota bacterium]
MSALLEVDGVQKVYGGLRALDGVSFVAHESAITSVIGPNGAGKTTLFNCIAGAIRPSAGAIRLAGRNAAGLPAHRISRLGVARTFQNLALFGGLTILENLMVGAYGEGRTGLLQGAFLSRRARAERREAEGEARRALSFVGLDGAAARLPGELPYGGQKRAEFARALMQRARLLLLDEPMAGMGSAEKGEMSDLIRRVRDERGLTVLIVEHDIPVVMSLSDRIVVLDFGRKIADGSPYEVRNNDAVIAAYLGQDSAA